MHSWVPFLPPPSLSFMIRDPFNSHFQLPLPIDIGTIVFYTPDLLHNHHSNMFVSTKMAFVPLLRFAGFSMLPNFIVSDLCQSTKALGGNSFPYASDELSWVLLNSDVHNMYVGYTYQEDTGLGTYVCTYDYVGVCFMKRARAHSTWAHNGHTSSTQRAHIGHTWAHIEHTRAHIEHTGHTSGTHWAHIGHTSSTQHTTFHNSDDDDVNG